MSAPPAPVPCPSPNSEPRPGGRAPDLLILHYTGMASAQAALERLCAPEAKVSAHYCIDEDGTLYSLVAEERRAWHAGRACWEGERDVNARSIGIELVNPGHELGYRSFPEAQIGALIPLARAIVERWAIAPWHVLGHSDVAPQRKRDPGERFPWRRLAEAGIGLWPPLSQWRHGPRGQEAAPAETVQHWLARFGYDVLETGSYDGETRAVIAAFQRHWRPQRVDGVADRESVTILEDVVRAKRAGVAPQQ